LPRRGRHPFRAAGRRDRCGFLNRLTEYGQTSRRGGGAEGLLDPGRADLPGRFFADEGKLLALFGGSDDVVARGRPVYSAFCSDIAHVGQVGHGQVAKAINNLLLWITSIGLIEAGRIAESTGIDLPKLRDALMLSSAKSQALEDWDQTTFTWALKDMQIVGSMADAAGLALPITGAVKELVKEARRIKATNPPRWTGSK
jgi:3-hydroxyisobutyrate dehydrogenase/2-hydroxy-3-oxopropionate reductase